MPNQHKTSAWPLSLAYAALVVYADREHAANLHWLTGFDPRFEEAVLLLTEAEALLLAGNECLAYTVVSPLVAAGKVRTGLCASLSLPSQVSVVVASIKVAPLMFHARLHSVSLSLPIHCRSLYQVSRLVGAPCHCRLGISSSSVSVTEASIKAFESPFRSIVGFITSFRPRRFHAGRYSKVGKNIQVWRRPPQYVSVCCRSLKPRSLWEL